MTISSLQASDYHHVKYVRFAPDLTVRSCIKYPAEFFSPMRWQTKSEADHNKLEVQTLEEKIDGLESGMHQHRMMHYKDQDTIKKDSATIKNLENQNLHYKNALCAIGTCFVAATAIGLYYAHNCQCKENI